MGSHQSECHASLGLLLAGQLDGLLLEVRPVHPELKVLEVHEVPALSQHFKNKHRAIEWLPGIEPWLPG